MNLQLNNKPITVTKPTTVYDLLQEHFLPQAGIAIAINNRVVPKSQWETTLLCEGDCVVAIQAACGG